MFCFSQNTLFLRADLSIQLPGALHKALCVDVPVAASPVQQGPQQELVQDLTACLNVWFAASPISDSLVKVRKGCKQHGVSDEAELAEYWCLM